MVAALVLAFSAAPAHAVFTATGQINRDPGGSNTLQFVLENDPASTEDIEYLYVTLPPGYTVTSVDDGGLFDCSPLFGEAYCDLSADAVGPGDGLAFLFETSPAPYPQEPSGDTFDIYGPSLSNLGLAVSGPSTPPPAPATPAAPDPPAATPFAPFQNDPVPVQNQTEVVEVLAGTVLVRQPGQKTFTRVSTSQAIKDGSEIDTKSGTARVKVAKDAAGTLASAEVSKGIAIVDQTGPLTQIKLSEKLTGCASDSKRAKKSAKKPKKRSVFVKTKDNFQSRGNHAAGTVRGTQWTTTDDCDSTTIKVSEGTVSVRDLVKKKTVPVTAPKSYTAKDD